MRFTFTLARPVVSRQRRRARVRPGDPLQRDRDRSAPGASLANTTIMVSDS
jgi:hypothetical protein